MPNSVGRHVDCGGQIQHRPGDPYAQAMEIETWKCDRCNQVWFSKQGALGQVEERGVLVWKVCPYSRRMYAAVITAEDAVGLERVKW